MNSESLARPPLRRSLIWATVASVLLASCTSFQSQEDVFSEISFSSDARIGVIHANGWDDELLAEVNGIVRQLRLANAGAKHAYSVLSESPNMTVVHILEPELRYFPDDSALESPPLTAAKENLDAIVEFQVRPLLLSDGRGGEIGYRRIRISTWLTLYSGTGNVAWRSSRAIDLGASSNAGSVYFPATIEQRGNINNLAVPLTTELLEALPMVARSQ